MSIPEFVTHIVVVAFLLGVFYVLLTWRSKARKEATDTVVCETEFNSLKFRISTCRTEYMLLKLQEEIEAYFNRYHGKVNDHRLLTYWNDLKRRTQLRQQELTGHGAYG